MNVGACAWNARHGQRTDDKQVYRAAQRCGVSNGASRRRWRAASTAEMAAALVRGRAAMRIAHRAHLRKPISCVSCRSCARANAIVRGAQEAHSAARRARLLARSARSVVLPGGRPMPRKEEPQRRHHRRRGLQQRRHVCCDDRRRDGRRRRRRAPQRAARIEVHHRDGDAPLLCVSTRDSTGGARTAMRIAA
jgi:hypothetical protein